VTTISKSQSFISVSIKDCTLRVPNSTTTLFLVWAIIKGNLQYEINIEICKENFNTYIKIQNCLLSRVCDVHPCCVLIKFAFITGNGSLELLLEGLFVQIHVNLSWRVSGRNRTGDLRIIKFVESRALYHWAQVTDESPKIPEDPPDSCLICDILLLSVYMCVRMPLSSRSIAGVPSSRALLGYPITAHHLCAFLLYLARQLCGGKWWPKNAGATWEKNYTEIEK